MDTTLEGIKMASTLATAIGESAPVPGLKTAGAILGEIVNIIRQTRQNKEDADTLLQNISEYGNALVEATEGYNEDQLPLDLKKLIDNFRRTLEKIKEKLDRYIIKPKQKWKLIAYFFKMYAGSGVILECNKKVDKALNIYTLKVQTTILLNHQSKSCRSIESYKLLVEDDEFPGLFVAELVNQNGSISSEKVLAKRYDDRTKFKEDLSIYKKNKHPSLLQVFEKIDDTTSWWLIFYHPGRLAEDVFSSTENPSRLLLSTIQHLVKACRLIVKSNVGHDKSCVFRRSRIYMRHNHDETELVPVVAEFEPSAVDKWDPTAPDAQDSNNNIMTQGLFSAFIGMLNRAVTGDEWKPNFTKRSRGKTGLPVSRSLRFFLHYLYDYIWLQCKGTHDIVIDKLANEVKELYREVEDGESLDDFLIRKRPDITCAIWDIWEPTDVQVGDLGYMDGSDPLRPHFVKIDNVVAELCLPITGRNLGESALETVINFTPNSEGVWSSDPTSILGLIRYTLHLEHVNFDHDHTPLVFELRRGYMHARLGSKIRYEVSWRWMKDNREKLLNYSAKHAVLLEDIILVQTISRSDGYTEIKVDSKEWLDSVLRSVGASERKLYYYDNLEAKEGEVTGYWSTSDQPGSMLWPATWIPLGPEWGWVHTENGFEVEVKRRGPRQTIRYLSLKEGAHTETIDEHIDVPA